MRFGKAFVQKRFCAEHRIIWERATAEQHAIRPDEAIIPDANRRGCLSIFLKVNAVRENLRLKSCHGRESADHD